MRRDRFAGFEDVADVRLTVLVEGGGHADQDGFDLGDAGEVGGGFEGAGFADRGDLRGLDMLDVGAARVDGVDLRRVDVEAEDGDLRLGEAEAERKPDIAETDDGDFHEFSCSVSGSQFPVAGFCGSADGSRTEGFGRAEVGNLRPEARGDALQRCDLGTVPPTLKLPPSR